MAMFHFAGMIIRDLIQKSFEKLDRHRGLEPRTIQQSWLSSALPDELMAVFDMSLTAYFLSGLSAMRKIQKRPHTNMMEL